MFYYALSFRQVLCWNIPKVTSRVDMFKYSGGSLLQYPECTIVIASSGRMLIAELSSSRWIVYMLLFTSSFLYI